MGTGDWTAAVRERRRRRIGRAARQSAMEPRHDVTGISPNEIRSEQIHGRLPSLDWRHV